MRTFMAAIGTALIAVLLAGAPNAVAATYADTVVGKFGPQTHVVSDPAAKPPLNNVAQVNTQINSSGKAIYVAAVAANQTGQTGPDQIEQAFLTRNGKFNGVILVIDSNGYHVKGYNVDSAISAALDPAGQDSLIKQEAAKHPKNPDATVSAFVNDLAAVKAPAPGSSTTTTTTKTTSQPHQRSYAWVVWLLGGIAVACLLAVVVALFMRRSRKREEARDQLNGIEADLINLRPKVDRLGRAGAEVNEEYMAANVAHGDATKAWKRGDVSEARAHVQVVKDNVRIGTRKLEPQPTPSRGNYAGSGGLSASAFTTPNERRSAESTHQPKQASVQATSPQGTTVTINNTNYRQTQQPGYGYYNPTPRYYNGMFFDIGYWPYDPWSWGMNSWTMGAVMYENAVLRDDLYYGGTGYGYGGDYGGGVDTTTETTTETTTTFDGGGNDDSDAGNWDQTQQSDAGFDGQQDTSGDDSGYDGGNQDTQQSDTNWGGTQQDTSDSGSGWSGGDSGGGGFGGFGDSGGGGGGDFGGGGGGDFGGGGGDFGGGGGGDFSGF